MKDKIVKTMRLEKSLIEKVKAIAKSQNRNFTNMVESILMDFIENWEKK